MTLTIRPARAGDAAAVRGIAEAAYARYVPGIGRKPAPMVADFATQIAGGHVHVAERAGVPVGYIVFVAAAGDMLLENVALHPGAAGQGIGTALMSYCEAAARASGARAVRLYTNEKMTENLSLYPHLVYAETHRAVQDGFARVFFEKRL